MPLLGPAVIQPPSSRDLAEWSRLHAIRTAEAFDAHRTAINELGNWETMHLHVPAPSAATYAIGLVPANRRIQAVDIATRSGTCDAVVKHGANGAEVSVPFAGLSPATTIPVTTTPTRHAAESKTEDVAALSWAVVTVSNLSSPVDLSVAVLVV